MRTDNRLKSIQLTKRPNGRDMKMPKPMRVPRPDAERLVDAGRASFISKSKFKKMTSQIEASQGTKKTANRGKKKKK